MTYDASYEPTLAAKVVSTSKPTQSDGTSRQHQSSSRFHGDPRRRRDGDKIDLVDSSNTMIYGTNVIVHHTPRPTFSLLESI